MDVSPDIDPKEISRISNQLPPTTQFPHYLDNNMILEFCFESLKIMKYKKNE